MRRWRWPTPTAGNEEPAITGRVATNDSDVDDGPRSATASMRRWRGTLNVAANQLFDAGNAAYQHLAQGRPPTWWPTYTVTDEHGAAQQLT